MGERPLVLFVGEALDALGPNPDSPWRWLQARTPERAWQMLTAAECAAVVFEVRAAPDDPFGAMAHVESARPEVPVVAIVEAEADLTTAVLAGCDDALVRADVHALERVLRKAIARAETSGRVRAALESRVAERTQALAATNQELQAFAYAVSHDLREPLRSLEGFSLALLEDYGAVVEGDGALYIERIRAATRRLSDRIDALLALSRATRREMRFVMVDLSALFSETFGRFAARAPEREVEVLVEPGVVVTADPDLCAVLVENLASNAWKFTREAPARIWFERHDGGLRLRDDGCGFDPSYAERIFTAFGRFHAPHEYEGTGIGLTTVQRIVHRHGGRIRAEGQVGVGASFCFTLPGAGCSPTHSEASFG